MSQCYIDMYIACFVNTVKHQIILKYIQKLSSYLTENTTRLQYKDQLATGGSTRSPFRNFVVPTRSVW